MRQLFEFFRMLCLRIWTSLGTGKPLLPIWLLLVKAAQHILPLLVEFGMHLSSAYLVYHELPVFNFKEILNALIITAFYIFRYIIRTFF